jgi:hypothetical protein
MNVINLDTFLTAVLPPPKLALARVEVRSLIDLRVRFTERLRGSAGKRVQC